jgi:hypothetical protein
MSKDSRGGPWKYTEGGSECLDLRMIEAKELLGRTGGDNPAGLEKNDARGEEECLAQIVGDENDGLAKAASESAEFVLEFGARDGIKSAEGFIHQKNRRVRSKGACDANALTLAAGEFARAAGGKLPRIEPYECEEFLDARGGTLRVPFFERGH